MYIFMEDRRPLDLDMTLKSKKQELNDKSDMKAQINTQSLNKDQQTIQSYKEHWILTN